MTLKNKSEQCKPAYLTEWYYRHIRPQYAKRGLRDAVRTLKHLQAGAWVPQQAGRLGSHLGTAVVTLQPQDRPFTCGSHAALCCPGTLGAAARGPYSAR